MGNKVIQNKENKLILIGGCRAGDGTSIPNPYNKKIGLSMHPPLSPIKLAFPH